jgi:hypothetical protein
MVKNKSEKFIHALAAANLLLLNEGLFAQTLVKSQSISIDDIEIVEDISREDIKNEHNGGCGNAGCGANNGC